LREESKTISDYTAEIAEIISNEICADGYESSAEKIKDRLLKIENLSFRQETQSASLKKRLDDGWTLCLWEDEFNKSHIWTDICDVFGIDDAVGGIDLSVIGVKQIG
jgi:hypothetical protein